MLREITHSFYWSFLPLRMASNCFLKSSGELLLKMWLYVSKSIFHICDWERSEVTPNLYLLFRLKHVLCTQHTLKQITGPKSERTSPLYHCTLLLAALDPGLFLLRERMLELQDIGLITLTYFYLQMYKSCGSVSIPLLLNNKTA